MWDDVAKQVRVERELLNRLLSSHRSLPATTPGATPSVVELAAHAAMLHSFYTGVENIFKRISLGIDKDLPSGDKWHVDLLNKIATATPQRHAVTSAALRDQLACYLEFRHFFRHAYTFQLRWEKMASLALGCEGVLRQLEAELDGFFATRM